MALTSTVLSGIATSLRDMAGALCSMEEAAGAQIADIENSLASVKAHSKGPRIDGADAAVSSYLDVVGGAPTIISSLRGTVSSYATVAELLADSMRSAEGNLSLAYEQSAEQSIPVGDVSDYWDARRSIDGIREQWSVVSSNMAALLNDDGALLATARNASAMGPPYAAVPVGLEYAGIVAQFAVEHGVSISFIDPTGQLQQHADSWVAMMAGGPDGGLGSLVFLIMETASHGDLNDHDGKLSWDDIVASTDSATIEALIQQLNEHHGGTATPEQVQAIVDLIVAGAWLVQASENENWEGVDDARNNAKAPSTGDVDLDSFWDNFHEIQWDAVGATLDAGFTLGPIAGSGGAALIGVDEGLALVVSHGVGAGFGNPSGGIGAGPIVTNAQAFEDLGGYSVCTTAEGGSGAGGSGTFCRSIQPSADGGWVWGDIWSAQGNISLVTPSAGGSFTVVESHVVWDDNGYWNVVRKPVQSVAPDSVDELIWTTISPGTFVVCEVIENLQPQGGLGEQAPGPIESADPPPT